MTNYRSVGFNVCMEYTAITGTKEEIVLSLLVLGEEKGLSNVSMADIAMAVGIRKASLYSHFESYQALLDATVTYCQEILKNKTFVVDFKAKDAQSLLESLVDSFLETFAESPLCSYLSIIQQQRMFDETFERLYTSLLFMVTARIRVALEYCVQRSWLDISDTDIASDYFASAVMQCLCDVIRQDRKNPSQNHTDWELDRLVQGLLTLFG